ncbi:MAG: hypothetical protein ACFBRM_16030 [Pikeienuella sp.]
MASRLLLVLCLLSFGCSPEPEPLALPQMSAPSVEMAVVGGLPLPARLGLLRVSGGRLGPVPGREAARWRAALREVNRMMPAPIRFVPMAPPGQIALEDGVFAAVAAARRAGLDGLLVYELSVRPENDHVLAALADLPFIGGAVPGTRLTTAQAAGTAILLGSDGRQLGMVRAGLVGTPIAPLALTGGDGDKAAGLAAYAMLNALAPMAEDMLTEAVAAAY